MLKQGWRVHQLPWVLHFQNLCLDLSLAAVQSKSLYSVRTAFKLMQNDLDPLLQGMMLCARL